MNFLAHAYLSFGQPEILTGNIISDFVKGRKKFDYSERIQKGIQLHRNIDAFTDAHDDTKKAASVFKPSYRLYSAAFIDVVFDHFLANDATIFTENTLLDFTQNVYMQLDQHFNELPGNFQAMFPHMKTHNWLFNYRTRVGIERSFSGLVRRATYLTESATAYKIFVDNYDFLQKCYEIFFPQLLQYAKNEFERLND